MPKLFESSYYIQNVIRERENFSTEEFFKIIDKNMSYVGFTNRIMLPNKKNVKIANDGNYTTFNCLSRKQGYTHIYNALYYINRAIIRTEKKDENKEMQNYIVFPGGIINENGIQVCLHYDYREEIIYLEVSFSQSTLGKKIIKDKLQEWISKGIKVIFVDKTFINNLLLYHTEEQTFDSIDSMVQHEQTLSENVKAKFKWLP